MTPTHWPAETVVELDLEAPENIRGRRFLYRLIADRIDDARAKRLLRLKLRTDRRRQRLQQIRGKAKK